jgi:PTS system nitrogen regulatory IIA component
MRILDILTYDRIVASLKATSKEEALAELVDPIARSKAEIDRAALVRILIDRENLGSTGIGGGIAIPHGTLDRLDAIISCFGKSAKGIDFGSIDGKPAHLFFLLVAPRNSAGEHLKALARISRLFKDPILARDLRQADSADEIYQILEEADLRLP